MQNYGAIRRVPGLQWSTVRNMALAWVLTLPAAITLAGVLYFILRQVF